MGENFYDASMQMDKRGWKDLAQLKCVRKKKYIKD